MKRRVGIHSRCFLGTGIGGRLSAIAEKVLDLGGNTLEFPPDEFRAMQEKEKRWFADLCRRNDLELVMTAGRSPGTDPTSPDPEIQAAAYRRGIEMTELMHSIDCHKWDGLIYGCWPGKPPALLSAAEKERIMERSASNIRRIMPRVGDYGITLCFEVVNRYEHYLINTAQEGLKYCEMIGHPNAQLLLDTFHMNIEEKSLSTAILNTAQNKRLAHFHVGEADRSIPGTQPSHMCWSDIFGALKDGNYTGSIVLEPGILPDNEGAQALCLWRDLSGGCNEERYFEMLEEGFRFVRRNFV